VTDGPVEEPPVPPGVDPEVPSPARLYDYYLGGRINYRAEWSTWTTTPWSGPTRANC
jgi:hypothetical protein